MCLSTIYKNEKEEHNILCHTDVAIANDRNGNVLLDLPDNFPVRRARVILFPGPAVYGNGSGACLFCNLCNLHGIGMALIKTLADFDSHWLLDGLNDL